MIARLIGFLRTVIFYVSHNVEKSLENQVLQIPRVIWSPKINQLASQILARI